MRATAIILSAIVALSGTSGAQSFEVTSAASQALGGAAMLTEPRPADNLAVLSAGDQSGLVVQADYIRQFEMSEFGTSAVAAAYNRSGIVAAIGFSQFGKSQLYTDQLVRGAVGLALRKFCAGVLLSGRHLEFGYDYPALNAYSVGVSGSYRLGRLAIGLTADNLNQPRFDDSAAPEPRRLSLFAEYSRSGDFQLVGRVTAEDDQDPRIALGQQIALSSKARILWGVHSAPFEYGGALQLTMGGFELTFATSYHPVLGFTTAGGLMVEVGRSRKE